MCEKFVAVLITLSICIVGLCNCTAADMPGIYLALGDSISTGYGLEDSNYGFATAVSELSGLELATRAVNGATANDVYNQLSSGELDETIGSAQLITLTCGGNDMLDILYGQIADAYNKTASEDISAENVSAILADSSDSRRMLLALRALVILAGNEEQEPFVKTDAFAEGIEQYKDSLKKIIKYIRERNPDAQIVVATQYNPYKSFENSDFSVIYTSIDDCLSVLNEVVVSGAEKMNYTVADVYTAFRSSDANLCNSDPETMNLDFHPNFAGHGVIAQCIAELIGVKTVTFADVSETDWFNGAVQYVSVNGLFGGVAEGRFAPDMHITRGMLVTVLYRAEGQPEVANTGSFEDVPSDSYYREAVEWAKVNGIVNGYTDALFAPGEPITRQQLAAIVLRYCRYRGDGPMGAWAIRLDYTDLSEIADYAGEAVMYCTMKGYMTGRDDGTFAPDDRATRAEAAVIIQRIMQ